MKSSVSVYISTSMDPTVTVYERKLRANKAEIKRVLPEAWILNLVSKYVGVRQLNLEYKVEMNLGKYY